MKLTNLYLITYEELWVTFGELDHCSKLRGENVILRRPCLKYVTYVVTAWNWRCPKPGQWRALCLTTLFSRRPHARMPLLILGVGIAEPPPARRAVHRRRIIARLIVGRHALTQALEVRALRFFYIHWCTSCRHSTRVYLKCIWRGFGGIRPARKETLSPLPSCKQAGVRVNLSGP
jgi:hypothetical protein